MTCLFSPGGTASPCFSRLFKFQIKSSFDVVAAITAAAATATAAIVAIVVVSPASLLAPRVSGVGLK